MKYSSSPVLNANLFLPLAAQPTSQYFLFLTSMSDTISQPAKSWTGEFVEGIPLNLVSRVRTRFEMEF